jgi:hypothetical protein
MIVQGSKLFTEALKQNKGLENTLLGKMISSGLESEILEKDEH